MKRSEILSKFKYRIFSRRNKRTLLSFLFVSLLIVPFQNCKKFESSEAPIDSNSFSSNSISNNPVNTTSNGSNSTSNTGGTGADPSAGGAPPVVNPAQPSEADLAAEAARKQRCKDALQKPVITNSASINGTVFNVNSGLGAGSGDSADPAFVNISVDPSLGVKASVQASDNCSYRTRLLIAPVDETGRNAQFSEAIAEATGTPINISATNTPFVLMSKILSPGNQGNNDTFTAASTSLGFNIRLQTNNNRTIFCATGTLFYKVTVRVETLNLQQGISPTTNTNIISDPIYVRGNASNSCWNEHRLIASYGDFPTNASVGKKVAISGDWAAALSELEADAKGSVHIFKRSGLNWSFTQKITMPAIANNYRLSNLKLSGSLLIATVGGFTLGGISFPGRAYLFRESAGTWSPYVTLDAPESSNNKEFGVGLAIGSNEIAIGDPKIGNGKIYFYTLTGASAGSLSSPGAANFGRNIVYNEQNGKYAVGAYDTVSADPGSVYVITKSTSWTIETSILPSSVSNTALFGKAIAFNGNTIAIGAENHTAGNNSSAGRVFYYSSYLSAPQHILTGTESLEKIGSSLALSSDSLFIGAKGSNSAGRVYRHLLSNLNSSTATTRDIRTYTQFSTNTQTNESFGDSMDYDSTGLIVGIPAKVGATSSSSNSGAAYIYDVR